MSFFKYIRDIHRIFIISLLTFSFILLLNTVRDSIAITRLSAQTNKKLLILKGKEIVLQSGCVRCHSFVKGKQIKGYDTLADFGDRHLSIKETEKAIRSCKMDPYCSQILTNKQVRYVAYYLNSLKEKGGKSGKK